MLSTYYIYYIVTTYYVVNGINILDYLHNDNSHNGGKAFNMSTLCPTVKGALCVCYHAQYAVNHAIDTPLAWDWVDQSSPCKPTPRVTIDWV